MFCVIHAVSSQWMGGNVPLIWMCPLFLPPLSLSPISLSAGSSAKNMRSQSPVSTSRSPQKVGFVSVTHFPFYLSFGSIFFPFSFPFFFSLRQLTLLRDSLRGALYPALLVSSQPAPGSLSYSVSTQGLGALHYCSLKLLTAPLLLIL